jgi:hypothetical protein
MNNTKTKFLILIAVAALTTPCATQSSPYGKYMLASAAEPQVITNELGEITAIENWQTQPQLLHRIYEPKTRGDAIVARTEEVKALHAALHSY